MPVDIFIFILYALACKASAIFSSQSLNSYTSVCHLESSRREYAPTGHNLNLNQVYPTVKFMNFHWNCL